MDVSLASEKTHLVIILADYNTFLVLVLKNFINHEHDEGCIRLHFQTVLCSTPELAV